MVGYLTDSVAEGEERACGDINRCPPSKLRHVKHESHGNQEAAGPQQAIELIGNKPASHHIAAHLRRSSRLHPQRPSWYRQAKTSVQHVDHRSQYLAPSASLLSLLSMRVLRGMWKKQRSHQQLPSNCVRRGLPSRVTSEPGGDIMLVVVNKADVWDVCIKARVRDYLGS